MNHEPLTTILVECVGVGKLVMGGYKAEFQGVHGYCGSLFTEQPVFELGQHYRIGIWEQ